MNVSTGGIKVTAITARNMMNELMLQHDLSEVAADALGRSIICGLLLSNGMQEEQTYQLTINGDGPLRGVFSICTGKGEARGYVGNSALNGFNLEEAIGKGTVQVVKNHPEWPNPFNGITAIRHGDIDRDVGIYLAESEQRSCALAAGTCVSNILFKAACGYLVEQLPEVETKVIEKVEQNLQDLVGKHGGDVSVPTNLFLNGISPFQISEQILDGLEMMPLQQITPVLKCECTEDRLFRSIRLLPLQEVEEILEENNGVEARCHFCGKKYKMNALQVRERFANAKGDPSHG